MSELKVIIDKLNIFFDIAWCWKDPAMSKFFPDVYDQIGFNWKDFFEPDFVKIFNGLMIKWFDKVKKIYVSVFPAPEVLESFLQQAEKWDVLFLHHPILMRSWDPQWWMWKLFEPMDPEKLQSVKDKQLSIYSCHTPLDINNEIWTNVAIGESLWWKLIDEFLKQGNGFSWKIFEIPQINTDDLIHKCISIFNIPYLDFSWVKKNIITKIAVVAWSGDKVEYMAYAEEFWAQAYLSGEIFNRVNNDYGRSRYKEVKSYAENTKMSLIGVSHAASEYLVMKTQLLKFIETKINIPAILLPMKKWRAD